MMQPRQLLPLVASVVMVTSLLYRAATSGHSSVWGQRSLTSLGDLYRNLPYTRYDMPTTTRYELENPNNNNNNNNNNETVDDQAMLDIMKSDSDLRKFFGNPGINDAPNKQEAHEYNHKYIFEGPMTFPITLHSDFLINPTDLCPQDAPVEYVMLIHTSTDHHARRKSIRATFGGRGIFGGITQRVVFLVGTSDNDTTSAMIRREAADHGDIVQGPFVDSYHNLTHKAVMGLRWVAEHCSHARYIMKADDDAFINIFRVIQTMFPSLGNQTKTITCAINMNGMGYIFRDWSKWRVDRRQFRDLDGGVMEHYPFSACMGFFAVMTSDLVLPMLEAAERVPFFWIDDVYMFGMLPDVIGDVTMVDWSDYSSNFFDTRSCLRQDGIRCPTTVLNKNSLDKMQMYMLWAYLTKSLSDEDRKMFKMKPKESFMKSL